MKRLKVALGIVSLWWFSSAILSTNNDIKIFTYKIDSWVVTFIILFLILIFIILSFQKFKILSAMVAAVLSLISTYWLFSLELPFSESTEQLGLTFISFLCLFFSVVDYEGNYIDHPIYGAISLNELKEHLHASEDDDLHYLIFKHSVPFSINEQSQTVAFDDGTHHQTLSIQEINPATGLPSVGGIDVLGNPYGCDLSSHLTDSHHSYDAHTSTYGDISNSINTLDTYHN